MTEPLSKDYSLSELTALFGGEVNGDASVRISRIASLDSAQTGDLTFVTGARYQAQLEKTRASAVILGPQLVDATTVPRIVCDNPYAYYARVCALLNPSHRQPAGIHDRAHVSPTVRRSVPVAMSVARCPSEPAPCCTPMPPSMTGALLVNAALFIPVP
jgi:UDP-3-O-[3-hydroxymyristoyl] glucosamine N-acyltransferase